MTNTVKAKLKEFKLAVMLVIVDERINYANENGLPYGSFLELLYEDEENNRRDNSYKWFFFLALWDLTYLYLEMLFLNRLILITASSIC